MNKTYEYRSRGSMWGLILIVLGCAFLGDNLGWFRFDIWEILWPALIIIVGVNMILRRNHRRVIVQSIGQASAGDAAQSSAAPPPPPPSSGPSQGRTVFDTDQLNESHAMGEIDLKVDSQAFRGGYVSTVFGDIRIDCDRAVLADGEQLLSINTVFGALKIYVPSSWEYTVESTTVFGEVEAAGTRRGGVFSNVSLTTQGFTAATRRLRINASTVFGEVRIISR